MPRTASDEENKRIIMDLDVLVKSYNFPHIVCCLGYFIRQVKKKLIIVFDLIFHDLD